MEGTVDDVPNRSAALANIFIMVTLFSETFAIQVLLVLYTPFFPLESVSKNQYADVSESAADTKGLLNLSGHDDFVIPYP